MADALINLLQSRTVLIRAGKAVGTGTLIAPGVVLTCAHVVRKSWVENETILVSLPDLATPGQFIWENRAQEVYMSNIYEEFAPDTANGSGTITLKTEYPDVAVIQITQKRHAMIELSLDNAVTDELQNGQFLAFGFQKRDANLDRNVPQTVSLSYEGAQLDGSIKKLMFTHGLVRPGMSGAAIVERSSGKIIGLVHMTRSSNDNLGAYVIPTEAIWMVIKKWEEEGKSKLYSLLTSKQHKRRIDKEYFKEYPRNPMLKKYGIKLAIFLVLLILFLWWYSFHVGQPQNSGLFAIILAGLSIFGIFLGNWLGTDVRNEIQRIKSTSGKWFLKSGVLIGIAFGIFVLWHFNTSIWIYGNSEHNEIPIMMYSGNNFDEGEQKKIDSTGKIRFFIPLVFKGDSVKLVPKGREPKFLSIKPYSRKVLYYPKDFLLEPVLLIRFDPNYLNLMQNYYIKIKVVKADTVDDEQKFVYLDSTLTAIGSISLGARQLEITKERKDKWKEPLQGASIKTIDSWVSKWENPKLIDGFDLNMGDKVKITVFKKFDHSIVNEQRYSISDDNTDKIIKFKFQ